MSETVLGLFVPPLGGMRDAGASSRSPVALYRRAIAYRANPRPIEMMRELFHRQWPQGEFIDVANDRGWVEKAASADRIVLLYPDAIGLGAGRIERDVFRARAPHAAVTVLNGRRRQFVLTRGRLRRIRVRRALEWTMLPEILVFIPAFLIVTPALVLLDLARGRR